MKKSIVVLFSLLLSISISYSQQFELSKEDKVHLVKEIKTISKSFNEGNAELLIEKTHPVIYTLVGGEENFKKALIAGVEQIMATGIKFVSEEVDEPTHYYKSGDEMVCFVPKRSVLEIEGKKVSSKGFMIAAKKPDGKWLYLDGAGLRRNPKLLQTFFPGLPKDVKLPPNETALLEE